jgi:L-seryl-tRNA(Ser) seleniumtransferase
LNRTAANPAGSTAVAAATAAPAATGDPSSPPWRVVTCPSVPGGGTLPGVEIESVGHARPGDHLDALRAATPPNIGRVHDGETILDLRTVDPAADHHVRLPSPTS